MQNYEYQNSNRSKSFERPQPLRRGQGAGGGNYTNLQTGIRTSVSQPNSRSSDRSRSISPSSRPGSSSSNSSRTSGDRNQYRRQPPPVQKSYRASPSGSCVPYESEVESSISKRSSLEPTTRQCTGAGYGTSSQPLSDANRRNSARGTQRIFTPVRRTPIKKATQYETAKSSSAPQKQTAVRRSSSPTRPNAGSLRADSSPKPGPSCLRPPPTGGTQRRVQFSGVPYQGSGPSPDSRTRYKNMPDKAARRPRLEAELTTECSQASSPYGPSLYPLYPDQYETPYVSLPGPKQVVLMPGDIDPNETTIIDIVGLSEGDLVEVPGIPPQAPASLLEDAWNEYVKEAMKKDLKRRKRLEKEDKKAVCNTSGKSKKKKDEQMYYLPSFSHLNYVHQGRAFSFEEHGNVQVDDPNNPPYEGPSFRAPDPECQRARPFSYKSRKTTTRPYTDEERREIEEAGMHRAIRAIINEYNAKWDRDRAERGLTEDDLIDIDNDDCAPCGEVQPAPRDIFSNTDQYGFSKPSSPRSPEMYSKTQRQYPEEDLIAWDENSFLGPQTKSPGDCDLLTRTPTKTPPRRSSLPSPNLMGMSEPEEDLLGLRTPPRKPKCPSPIPTQNKEDLMRWESPGAALPFDVACEENVFDSVTRPSPTAARLKTPLSFQRESPQDTSQQVQPVRRQTLDFSSCPQKEPRIVRAIPMGSHPSTAVLESSQLAAKITSPKEEDDDSLGIIEFDNPNCPWQTDNFEEDFNKPLPPQRKEGYDPNISGVEPLNEFENDDLGIIYENFTPDFEYSFEAEARFREESKYQTIFHPLATGGQMLDTEECPFESEFEELGRQFQEERADLLNLSHDPEVGPVQRRDFGPLGSELVEQIPDPIEKCKDLLGLYEPSPPTPPRQTGPFSRELIESCPDEQQLIDFSDECQPEQRPKTISRSYSRDLFTNVKWDPSMANKKN